MHGLRRGLNTGMPRFAASGVDIGGRAKPEAEPSPEDTLIPKSERFALGEEAVLSLPGVTTLTSCVAETVIFRVFSIFDPRMVFAIPTFHLRKC